MDRLISFVSAVAPSLILLAYGIAKTRSKWNEEALWTAFLLGGVGAVAAIPLEFVAEKALGLFALVSLTKAGTIAVLTAAIPEETIKFFILTGASERHVDVRRRQDIILLALAVSLGFATMENLFYVVVPDEWRFVAAERALTAVPLHGITGLTMGALLTAARLRLKRQNVSIALALFVPIVFHAMYDFPLLALDEIHSKGAAAGWLVIVWLATLVVSAVIAIILCNRILPVAVEADRLSGRDSRPPGPAASLIVSGCGLLVASPVLGIVVFSLKSIPMPSLGAALCILPFALAVDLIWDGMRRYKTRTRGGARN